MTSMVANFLSRLTFPIFKRMVSLKKVPIIVVLGATGAGKTKLSIEIAQRFNGEIINADSLQVYKGLDIITNKATKEERSLVPHHLIDFLDPLTPMTVVDFRNRSLNIIDKLLKEGKIPVVVGGTHYYIESILWDFLIDAEKAQKGKFIFEQDQEVKKQTAMNLATDELNEETIFSEPILASSFKEVPGPHLHNILSKIDPETALILHPNEKRKVIRALQVIQRNSGKKYSTIINEQQSKTGGSSLGGPLRFKDTVIFWTHSQQDILNERLDKRVDDMLDNDLIKELTDFHEQYKESRIERGLKSDYTEGIFQAIGFKEFHEYLILPDNERDSKKNLLNNCILEMKIQTRKYAKKQIKWIRNRFIEANNRSVPPIFCLDTSQPEEWNREVRDKAFKVLDYFMYDQSLPHDLQPVVQQPKVIDKKTIQRCDVCDKVCQGEEQWMAHLKSKGHQALTKRSNTETNETNKVSDRQEVYSKQEDVKCLG